MRAAVVHRYGGPEVVEVVEVPDPVPGPGEVRVRVTAATVNSGDARIRAARFPPGFALPARLALGIRRPRRRILGIALAGTVDAVGRDVVDLAPGDRVCAMVGARMGAHAQLAVVAARRVARIPEGVSDDDAAGVLFGGTTALHFVRDRAEVGPGTTVLVNGASGAVGLAAVQIAHRLGARVTGVTSGPNAPLVTRLGAERTIDHTEVDVTTLDERWDVVIDAVGTLSIASGRRLLAPGGTLALLVAGLGELIRARGDVVAGSAPERRADVEDLLAMVAAGELTVVHEPALPLEEIVEAHRRVDGGHKVGNQVVHPWG